jgi:hypothetical protein
LPCCAMILPNRLQAGLKTAWHYPKPPQRH